MKVVTNPVEALLETGKQNTELHAELMAVYRELDWYRGALTYISDMPNTAGAIATAALQRKPYK